METMENLPEIFNKQQVLSPEVVTAMVEEVSGILALREKLAYVPESDALITLLKLNKGTGVIAKHLATVSYQLNKAKTNTKRIKAILQIERYEEWCGIKNKKPSAAQGEKWAMAQPAFSESEDTEAQYQALYQWLSDSKAIMIQAHDDFKKATYHRINDINVMS